jgi:two-component system response regulator YcbB
MRFYIVDDHKQVIRMLESIIEDEQLGEIVGSSIDSTEALNAIKALQPDVVIIDFLMPDRDGTQVVVEIKKTLPDTQFIMLSQVSAKNLIEKAYRAGISFFISKPVNRLEVSRVIRQVMEQLTLNRKFSALQNLLTTDLPHDAIIQTPIRREELQIELIKQVMSKIGILGESGAQDILQLCQYYLDNQHSTNDVKINDVCVILSEQPKAMEQRLRRAINRGLVNLANLGIEDYMNDVFVRYASTLYDFESIKAEMDYIRKKRTSGGKISVKKFLDNLMIIREH